MKLVVVLLPAVLVLGLDETEGPCDANEKCLPFSQCPGFFSQEKGGVCDRVRRAVCCQLESAITSQGSSLSQWTGEISGGRQAASNEFPFLARLRIQGRRGAIGFCAGSIISTRLIATAKHCLYNPTKGFLFERYCIQQGRCVVTLGEHFLDSQDPGEQKISIKTVHLVPGKPESDFAIIEMDSPAVIDNVTASIVKVSPAPLVPGDFVTTAGWGLTNRYSGPSNVLRRADLEVSRVKGEEVYTLVEVVGGVPVDPCEGDSGGPLVIWREESWTLAATLFGGGFVCTRGKTGEFEGDGVWNSVALNYEWIQSLLTSIGCNNDSECPSSQTCIQSSCKDPCIQSRNKVCGQDATCTTVRHRPVCSCPPGLLGNPNTGCEQDPCIPSPCGEGALCRSGRCECPKGFLGNPQIKCSMLNPCSLGPCGLGAECSVSPGASTATCTCPEGTQGHPFLKCSAEDRNPCTADSCPGTYLLAFVATYFKCINPTLARPSIIIELCVQCPVSKLSIQTNQFCYICESWRCLYNPSDMTQFQTTPILRAALQ